jgi:hypothetical protein
MRELGTWKQWQEEAAGIRQSEVFVGFQILKALLQSAGHGCRFATAIPGVPVNAVDLLSVFPAVSQDPMTALGIEGSLVCHRDRE